MKNTFCYVAVRTGLEPEKHFLLCGGAYGTRTRDPMRDRHVF